MDKRDCDRAFTDGRCHALDVAGSNIAYGENARTGGFEQIRRALEWPSGSGQILRRQVRSGLDKPLPAARDTAVQPPRIALAPRHQDHVPDRVTREGPGARAALHTFGLSLPLKTHVLGSRSNLDGRDL